MTTTGQNTPAGHSSIFSPSQQMSILIDQAQKQPLETQERAKAEERLKRYLFSQKAQKFVELWGKLAQKLENNEVDVKLAKKVSKAFHELEKSEGWPAK